MADKTLTIKNATNKELTSLLFRLRQEHEALRLTRELKIKSVPNPNGRYPAYSTLEGFSTETIVSNGKSIKTMDDEELALFLDRLRNENEVARIIADIREMNSPIEPYSDNQNYEGISMDTPVADLSEESVEHSAVDSYLEHFGIPGMKWGVRRARGSDGTVSSKKSTPTDMAVRKKSLETGATAAREAGNALTTFSKRKENEFANQKRAEAKKMSDKELKDAIGRLNLEQQYRNLSTRDIEIGKTTVQDFLAVSGNVLTVAAAGAGLALTIKQLASKV